MPELPEVETIVRELRISGLVGTTVLEVGVAWPRTIAHQSTSQFCDHIVGQIITEVIRRGKYLIFQLEKGSILSHLRMTGHFSFCAAKDEPLVYERVRLTLSDGRALVLSDTRKFGRMQWVADPQYALSHLGVEPLSPQFSTTFLLKRLKGRKRALKPLLLDQSIIAGLGNIYVDEALWNAGLHPLQPVNYLLEDDIERLHHAIVTVLQRGVDHLGTSLGSGQTNYFSVSGRRGGNQYQLRVFRRDGQPCLRCATILEKIYVEQRGTHYCPFCQQLRLSS